MKPIYEKNLVIKFSESDPQGYIYFARIFEMAHNALEDFWYQHKLGWKFWFQNPDFAVPIRHASSDYQRPLKPGKAYQLKLSVKNVTDNSVELLTEFYGTEKAASTLYAKVTTVHVFVNKASLLKRAVPKEIRAIFAD